MATLLLEQAARLELWTPSESMVHGAAMLTSLCVVWPVLGAPQQL